MRTRNAALRSSRSRCHRFAGDHLGQASDPCVIHLLGRVLSSLPDQAGISVQNLLLQATSIVISGIFQTGET
jgi:hypothetical protein